MVMRVNENICRRFIAMPHPNNWKPEKNDKKKLAARRNYRFYYKALMAVKKNGPNRKNLIDEIQYRLDAWDWEYHNYDWEDEE